MAYGYTPTPITKHIFFIGGLNYRKTPHKFVFSKMFGDKNLFECRWVVRNFGFFVCKRLLVTDGHLLMGYSTLLGATKMPEANKIHDITRDLVSNGMLSHNQDSPGNHLSTIHSLSVFPHYKSHKPCAIIECFSLLQKLSAIYSVFFLVIQNMCNFLGFFTLIVQICANFFSFKKSSKFTFILLTLILSSSIWVAQDTDLLLLMKDKTKPETPIEF